MRPGNAVKFPHVTLRLIPEILNPVNVILPVRKQCTVVYPIVLELGNIQHVVTRIQGVRVLEPRPSISSHHYGNGVALCYAYQELLFRNIQVL